MQIDVNLEGIEKIIKHLDPMAAGSAIAYTLNKSADGAKTYLAKEITSEYKIPPSDVKQNMKVIFKATASVLYAVLSIKGVGIPLIKFGAKQAGFQIVRAGAKDSKEKFLVRTKRRMGNVTVQVKKQGGRKVVNIDPGAFIQVMKSGHVGVFHRIGKERNPIKELYSIGPSKATRTKKISDGVKKYIINYFQANFLRNLAYFQGKQSGPGA